MRFSWLIPFTAFALLSGGCGEIPLHEEVTEGVQFFCVKGDDMFRDKLDIHSQLRGRMHVSGSTEYWYFGNEAYQYDDCFLESNGHRFDPSKLLMQDSVQDSGVKCCPCAESVDQVEVKVVDIHDIVGDI